MLDARLVAENPKLITEHLARRNVEVHSYATQRAHGREAHERQRELQRLDGHSHKQKPGGDHEASHQPDAKLD